MDPLNFLHRPQGAHEGPWRIRGRESIGSGNLQRGPRSPLPPCVYRPLLTPLPQQKLPRVTCVTFTDEVVIFSS